jgi:hydroxyacylglutathione hydrolase
LNRTLSQIYPNIWRLVADNPSVMTGPGTNTYLVGKRRLLIIDPGPLAETHQANIIAATQTLEATVEALIVTHHHADHSGGALRLAHRLKVPLWSYDDPLQAEAELEIEGLKLVVKHTPGHIQAHLCLWQPEQRLLFAGDLVAGQGTILVIPPDGDMAAYLDSLAAIQVLNPVAILPGHGPVIDTPQTLLQEYIDHRLHREQQVLTCLAEGYTTARQIAQRIYADRPEVLGIATLQTEAHLEKLRRERRV